MPPTPTVPPEAALRALIAAERDRLPLPGGGHTLQRWQALASVAAQDLSLAKLFEGHTDALAILAELGVPAARGAWATWCAEPPGARLQCSEPDPSGWLRLSGRKAWCSGAAGVDHALVSGWNAAGQACLAAVALDQSGVRITAEGWQATGMAATRSVDVVFDAVPARAVGTPGAYLQRPGFWQGGAGIAACWWGGAAGIARSVHAALAARGERVDAHQRAHLGQIDVALQASAALLRAAAAWIDAHPRHDAQAWALRVRLAAERAATDVLHHTGRALGAGPLCQDAALGRALADLPIFLRQSHAERDLAALGQHLVTEPVPWTL
ncbi:acyl-CoA dehydrogenase [Pseudorhodoferax sp.]|uniref:acyl-CoA dehydrogenase n=1 Tax=Pseudorhodoferax sp. TaxID=1993553 RepID=UPI002DD66052|nr:acyl-CoA dehydrogenase [Pseudorhodoferax sp.]